MKKLFIAISIIIAVSCGGSKEPDYQQYAQSPSSWNNQPMPESGAYSNYERCIQAGGHPNQCSQATNVVVHNDNQGNRFFEHLGEYYLISSMLNGNSMGYMGRHGYYPSLGQEPSTTVINNYTNNYNNMPKKEQYERQRSYSQEDRKKRTEKVYTERKQKQEQEDTRLKNKSRQKEEEKRRTDETKQKEEKRQKEETKQREEKRQKDEVRQRESENVLKNKSREREEQRRREDSENVLKNKTREKHEESRPKERSTEPKRETRSPDKPKSSSSSSSSSNSKKK